VISACADRRRPRRASSTSQGDGGSTRRKRLHLRRSQPEGGEKCRLEHVPADEPSVRFGFAHLRPRHGWPMRPPTPTDRARRRAAAPRSTVSVHTPPSDATSTRPKFLDVVPIPAPAPGLRAQRLAAAPAPGEHASRYTLPAELRLRLAGGLSHPRRPDPAPRPSDSPAELLSLERPARLRPRPTAVTEAGALRGGRPGRALQHASPRTSAATDR
jgi:hypothetical protein